MISPNLKTEKNLRVLFNNFKNESVYSSRLSKETIRGYVNSFILFEKIMPEIDTTDLLSQSALTEFFKRLETRGRKVGKGEIKTGVKKSTIRTYWAKLNVFFKWLEKKQYIEINPLEDIRPPRVSYDDYKRLEDEEINKIYSAIVRSEKSFMLRRDTMMVSLFVYLGIRRTEFISIQIKDLDLEKKQIIIKGETSKSKKTRALPIHPTLLMHIKDYLEERNKLGYKSEYLILSSRRDFRLTLDGLKHWVNKVIKISGVKFNVHRFRHTYACKIIEGHTPTASLQKLLGHSSLTMTEQYTRSLRPEDMAGEVGKISF